MRSHFLRAASPKGGGGFDPATDLTGLGFWVDVSDAATVTESGGTITGLTEKTGNWGSFVETGATRPTLTIAGVNGRNVAEFNGVDQWATWQWATGISKSDVIVAFAGRIIDINPPTMVYPRHVTFRSGTGADFQNPNWVPMLTEFTGNNLISYHSSSGGDLNRYDASSLANQPIVWTVQYEAATLVNRINGTQVANSSPTFTLSGNADQIRVANVLDTSTAQRSYMQLGELIFAPRSSNTGQLADLENYLLDKWIP